MLCKGHVVSTYKNPLLFTFLGISDDCGQRLPVLPLSSVSPFPLLPFFLKDKKKKCWMIYLCLSCTFGHHSSISGVWKTCFVVIAISLQCDLPCDWMLWFILFKLDIYLVSQTLFKTPKRMLPFVVASN